MRKVRKRIQTAVCLAVCLAVAWLAFLRVTALVQRKDSLEKYQPFYEQKEDFDVLLIGTSHMINGVFPMELWADYGIVSYNFGGHDNQPATTYWVLQNALQYTNPKMVVLDVFGAASQSKASDDLSYLHLSTDSMPFSGVKVKMLRDILPEYGNITDFLFDFSLYHNRWNELEERDFFPNITREKGAESRINVGEPQVSARVGMQERFEDESLGKEYIEKIVALCQERGIEILLVNLPFPASVEKQRNANSVYPIAEKYGVSYVNYLYQDGIVNYDTDVYDSDAHLNPSGARKVTRDLGRILSEEYHMPDHRQDEKYAGWWEDYEAYLEFKAEKLKEQNLKEYLMMLSDDDYDCYLYLPRGLSWDETGIFQKLLGNIAEINEADLTGTDAVYLSLKRSDHASFQSGKKEIPREILQRLEKETGDILTAVVADSKNGTIVDETGFDEAKRRDPA